MSVLSAETDFVGDFRVKPIIYIYMLTTDTKTANKIKIALADEGMHRLLALGLTEEKLKVM